MAYDFFNQVGRDGVNGNTAVEVGIGCGVGIGVNNGFGSGFDGRTRNDCCAVAGSQCE